MAAQKNDMFGVALRMFTDETIVDVHKDDDRVEFVTAAGGFGEITENFDGNWHVWIDDTLVYEIEHDIFTVLLHRDDRDLLALYGYITELHREDFQDRSKRFIDAVKAAVENLLLNGTVPVEGQTQIGFDEVIYKNGKKIRINLN